MASTWLIDTNVLLRFVPDDRDYPAVHAALGRLWTSGAESFYTTQNLAEFWNTCTRPADRNGYGLSVAETDKRARLIEEHFVLVAENHAAVYAEWRRLLVEQAVCGVQVHDARLAAVMRVAGIDQILTFNHADFARYPGVAAVPPAQHPAHDRDRSVDADPTWGRALVCAGLQPHELLNSSRVRIDAMSLRDKVCWAGEE